MESSNYRFIENTLENEISAELGQADIVACLKEQLKMDLQVRKLATLCPTTEAV